MTIKEIKELIETVCREPAIGELEVERSGVRVRIRRSGGPEAIASEVVRSGPVVAPPVATSPDTPPEATDEPEVASPEEPGLVYVTSPIVGTFYRASSPEADPFVTVGDTVAKGGVVCIIEAMKLMNEIEAEVAGEIVSIFVENGHPVEYGERLFAIRPR